MFTLSFCIALSKYIVLIGFGMICRVDMGNMAILMRGIFYWLLLLLCAWVGNVGAEVIVGLPTDKDAMVLVPAGEFIMGSNRRDEQGYQERYGFEKPLFINEHPEHQVSLDAFFIDQYEVTNAQFKAFIRATGHAEPMAWIQNGYNVRDDKLRTAHVSNLRWVASDYFKLDRDTAVLSKQELLDALFEIQHRRDTLPVTSVSWHDADNFCRWQGKRFPSEAEWEKAARGPDGNEYPWGNTWQLEKSNTGDGIDSEEVLMPAGSFPQDKSYYGIYDLGGNVSEWVADRYQSYPDASLVVSATEGLHRVVRGGGAGTGHYALSLFFRSARRAHADPEMRSTDVGFRCARDAE